MTDAGAARGITIKIMRNIAIKKRTQTSLQAFPPYITEQQTLELLGL